MLEDDSLNTKGIGARISITTSMGTQVREVRAGNNMCRRINTLDRGNFGGYCRELA